MGTEQVSERKPKSFVIRLFGIFAVLFGLAYFIQGESFLTIAFSRRYDVHVFLLQMAIITFDLVLGSTSFLVGAGLFFHKEWARKTWLAFLPLALFVHFNLTVLQVLAGYTRMTRVLKWIGVVILVTILSWAFLTRPSVKARFVK